MILLGDVQSGNQSRVKLSFSNACSNFLPIQLKVVGKSAQAAVNDCARAPTPVGKILEQVRTNDFLIRVDGAAGYGQFGRVQCAHYFPPLNCSFSQTHRSYYVVVRICRTPGTVLTRLGRDGEVVVCLRALTMIAFVFAVTAKGFALPQVNESHLKLLFEQAQDAGHRGDYKRSEELYRRILSEEPGILSARVNLGLACYWQDKKKQALEEFSKALQQDSRQYTSLLFSGLIYQELGLYDLAEKSFDSAYAIKSDDPLLLWGLGSLKMVHGDARAAVPYLQRSFELDPKNPRVVWLLGGAYAQLAYRQRGSPDLSTQYQQKANQALEWMAHNYPDSPLLHVLRGDVYAARKVTNVALQEYEIALKMDPDWPDLHLLIGSLEEVRSHWDNAVRELHLQLKQNPGDPRALLELGIVYARTGRNEEAIHALELAIQHDKQNYKAEFRLGQAYLNLRNYSQAVQHLERAIRLDPQESQPYYLLFRAYRALNEPAKSTQALKRFQALKASSDSR